jgi:acetylornithine deacetylase/succinyl-diaminopimelate desuccinylase-like protein
MLSVPNGRGVWYFTYFNLLLYSHIDANKDKYIATLKEAVAIQSVSAWPHKRDEIMKMAVWTKSRLEKLGTEVELCELGTQVCSIGIWFLLSIHHYHNGNSVYKVIVQLTL